MLLKCCQALSNLQMDTSVIGSMLYLKARDVPLQKFSREFDVKNIRKIFRKNTNNLIWGNNILR